MPDLSHIFIGCWCSFIIFYNNLSCVFRDFMTFSDAESMTKPRSDKEAEETWFIIDRCWPEELAVFSLSTVVGWCEFPPSVLFYRKGSLSAVSRRDQLDHNNTGRCGLSVSFHGAPRSQKQPNQCELLLLCHRGSFHRSRVRRSLLYLLISPQHCSNSQVFSLPQGLMQVVISIPNLMPSISPSVLLHPNLFIISSSPSPLPWLRLLCSCISLNAPSVIFLLIPRAHARL